MACLIKVYNKLIKIKSIHNLNIIYIMYTSADFCFALNLHKENGQNSMGPNEINRLVLVIDI